MFFLIRLRFDGLWFLDISSLQLASSQLLQIQKFLVALFARGNPPAPDTHIQRLEEVSPVMTRIYSESPLNQVCQVGVMSDFNIVTLFEDGNFDFKTITAFLFFQNSIGNRYFLRSKSDDMSVLLFAKRTVIYSKKYH